jgi:hypothetical protein
VVVGLKVGVGMTKCFRDAAAAPAPGAPETEAWLDVDGGEVDAGDGDGGDDTPNLVKYRDLILEAAIMDAVLLLLLLDGDVMDVDVDGIAIFGFRIVVDDV